jgi:hypothetical protein
MTANIAHSCVRKRFCPHCSKSFKLNKQGKSKCLENHINKCSPIKTSESTHATGLIPPIEARRTVAIWFKTHRDATDTVPLLPRIRRTKIEIEAGLSIEEARAARNDAACRSLLINIKKNHAEKAAAEKAASDAEKMAMAAAEKAAADAEKAASGAEKMAMAASEKKQEEKKKNFKLYQKEWYQKNKQRLQAKQRAYEAVYRNTGPIKKSSYTGIEWQRGVNKWRSTYKGKYIGIFEDERDAVEAREIFKDV